MKQGHIFFIMGVSGSGKGTLRTNLKNQNIENLEFLKSYVTRDMRPGEVNGEQYWFISKDEFERAIEAGEFLEYETNHKVAYYGTKKQEVEYGLQQGKILMKEIDTKGLKQVIENTSELRPYYTSFFLDVSNDEITSRYLERHPEGQEEDIQNRLESANFERTQAQEYCDYIIDATQTPEKVLSDVLDIIEKEQGNFTS